jgi:two-component system, OmpR family, phosphate regulon response regulator PhoB
VRGILYQFESFQALSFMLEAGGDEQDIELTNPEGLKDGEWLLATFVVGEDSTAVAGCVVDRGDGLRLAFQDRDWQMLWSFANSEDPPTIPPPSVQFVPIALEAPPDSSVLVIDDDPDVQTVVSAVLSRSGFGVSSVSSAEEAFDRMREQRVDLLVLDWNLPGMTGLDFCRRLRKEGRHGQGRVPVLFLTAHSSSQDLVDAFAAGADDFVSKPFRAPELAARVLGLVRRALMPPPSSRTGK